MIVQTGSWTSANALLALYRFHLNAAEHELSDLGISRDDVLDLIRHLEGAESGYRQTELATIATQMLLAYRIGKGVKP